MNNIIEDIQGNGKGQDEIEFEDDTNENSARTELDVASEQSEASTSEEYQIERKDIGEQQIVSDIDATAKSPTISPSSVSTQSNQNVQPLSDSKFFAIRTTGGQERVVANLLQTRASTKKLQIRSIIVLDGFKGYIIVEAPDSNAAYEALAGIRHVRGQIRGDLPFKDIEGYLVKKPIVSELSTNDTVEVIAGPFKAMKAKITRVDYEKQEATVVLLDSPYQIPVTVDANYLKRLAH
ncbi:MAG: transcription elongation factor Spt5 [Thermoproteota archaeon]|nr:transcription elongation factor Spt5 [Thermoproteota archaeon]